VVVKIPQRVKILGHIYTVKEYESYPSDTYGSHDPNTLTIRLNNNKNDSQIASTFLHEIIEAVNHLLELGLEHRQISGLESGLYQVLKDNKLMFD
jgi:hypothetical protein